MTRITVVAASAPEGHDKTGRRRQLPPRARARLMLALIAREAARDARRTGTPRRAVAGLFESGSYMRGAASRWARWRFVFGVPNNRLRDGTVRGNGALVRGLPGLRLLKDLPVDVGPRVLHFLVLADGVLGLAVIVGHRETRKADPDDEGRTEAAVVLGDEVRRLRGLGYAVLTIVDWNGGEPPGGRELCHFGPHDGVDWIKGAGSIRVGSRRVVGGWLVKRATDHGALVVVSIELEDDDR